QEDNGLALSVVIDRDSAARLGVSVGTVDNALYDAFGQRIVSTIFTQANQYRVILEADPQHYNSIDSLASLYVPSAAGGQVPLSAIAKVSVETRPLLINHIAQFPATTVSFNLAEGVSLGAAVKAIETTEAQMGLPSSIHTTFQGAALAFRNNLTNELLLLLAAVLVMYIVLGVLYESFIHPVTILSTLPSAGIGALLALIMAGDDLTIIALIGIILLIGIVKKNAILMIDFAIDAERNQGLPPREAIYQACLVDRFARRQALVALRIDGEVDHQDRVLLYDADQQDDADQRDDRQVIAGHDQRQQGADPGRGERGEDRDRVDEALVQHPQHDVHDEHGRQQQQELVGQIVAEGERRALERRVNAGGQPQLGLGRLDRLDGGTQRYSLGQVERDGGCGELCDVIDEQRP